MKDPLNPGPVKATDSMTETDKPTTYDDARPFWLRLLTSLRPSVSSGKNSKTGEKYEEFEIKGHVDF